MSFLRIYDHLKIQMEDILSATNNFDSAKLIGRGGFGQVYKGELSLPEGPIMVAFKKLDRRLGQGKTEFWKEVMILSKYKHENLISLMHYCIEGDEMILGYEYASRGSLDRYLSDASLTWTRRLKICVGAARGLNYLHDPNGGQQSVIHRDIKSGNILLDKKWMAKVSDFGLSKFGPAQTVLVSNGVGTFGYCDPLYLEMGFLSKESDVYSFGVVLFEVLCGRLCCEYNNGELNNILVSKWRQCYEKKTLDGIIFSGLKEQMDPSSLNAFSAIAYRCVKRDREERPTMAEVVKELEFALQVSKDNEQLKIQMKDILSATNNFDSAKLIGRGGLGLVYKAELSLPSGPIMVAFKKLDRRPGQGKVDLWKKVMMLSKYKHENLISLMHYCNKGDEMILGFDYASRGSLDRYLSDPSLTWTHRLKICIGAARGLNYLHGPSGEQQRVIHGDIKSGNILLDENWMAKVSDVGLLKVVSSNQAQKVLVSHAIGTPGYRDPFYRKIGFFSKESDVYSFGVVLFEILCGRLCCEYNNGVVTSIFVHKWRRYYEEKTIDQIIFPCLKEQMDPGSLNAFSAIAYQCVKKDREKRPIMAEVVKELEFALLIQDVFEDLGKRVDFETLIKIANGAVTPISYVSESHLYVLFMNGSLVDYGKTWIAINMNGEIIEAVSAIECILPSKSLSYGEGQKSRCRFRYTLVGSIDSSVVVKVKTHFLSPNVTYTINLVIKPYAYPPKTTLSRFIPFKYKLENEKEYWDSSRGEYIREDGWLIIELYQFTSYQNEHNFVIEFTRSTSYNLLTCYIEGIEFRPVEQVRFKNHEDNNKVDTLTTLPDSEIHWEEKLPTDYMELIKLSKDDQLQHTTKRELYFLFRKGFLVANDSTGNDGMWLSMSKSMKTRFMIPVTSFLPKEQWVWKRLLESRFKQVAMSNAHNYRWGFRIACKINSQLLSYQRNYSCHLIYKWSGSDSRHVGLLLTGDCGESSRDITLYTIHHTPFIGPKDEKSFQRSYDTRILKGHPKQRKDGWMEFQLCEVSSKANGDIILNFPVECYECHRYLNIVVEGLEFRPL